MRAGARPSFTSPIRENTSARCIFLRISRQRPSMPSVRTAGCARGDHIAVALSGDAASAALLFFLAKLTAARRDIRLSAITIDTGMSGSPAIAQARKRWRLPAALNGTAAPSAERYGTTMDEMVQKNGPEYCPPLLPGASRATCSVRLPKRTVPPGAHSPQPLTRPPGIFFPASCPGRSNELSFPRCDGKNAYSRDPAVHGYPGTGSDPVRAAVLREDTDLGRPAPRSLSRTGFPCGRCTGSAGHGTRTATLAAKFALANLAGTLAGIAAARGMTPSCPVCGEPIDGGECNACGIRRDVTRGTLL